jgi:hypothetical protein
MKFVMCIFVCLVNFKYNKGGKMEKEEMVLLGVLEGAYIPVDAKIIDLFSVVDLKFYRGNGVVRIMPDMPDSFYLELLESELLDQYGKDKLLTVEDIAHYIWRLSGIAKYAIKESNELDAPQIERYLYIAAITEGMAMVDAISDFMYLKNDISNIN